MRQLTTALTLVFLVGFVLVANAGQSANDYLTADGKLKNKLIVKDVQGGFAGFTGKMWTIEPNGAWTEAQVFNRKITPKKMGKLSNDELKKIAVVLAANKLLQLKSQGQIGANPHVVTIEFGKHKCTLQLNAGTPLPKGGDKTTESRYGGIARTVQAMLKK